MTVAELSTTHEEWLECPERPSATSQPERSTPGVADASALKIVWIESDSARSASPQPEIQLRGSIRIRGERFHVELEAGVVHLVHPKWSLMGSGDDLFCAQLDLLMEAKELAEIMVEVDAHELSSDAIRLRTFVLAFLTTNISSN